MAFVKGFGYASSRSARVITTDEAIDTDWVLQVLEPV